MSEPTRCFVHSKSFGLSSIGISAWTFGHYGVEGVSVQIQVSGPGVHGEYVHFTDPKALRDVARSMLEHADWLESEQAKEPTP